MMREHLLQLRARRSALLLQAAEEREALGAMLSRTDVLAHWLGTGVAALRRLRGNPWLIAGVVAGLVAIRPRHALRWLLRGWSAWRFYRALRASL